MQIEVKFNESNTVLAAEFEHYIEGPGGGGGTVEDLDAVLDAQEGLIDELKGILAIKASGGKAAVIEPLEVTENGTYEPDGIDGFAPVVVSVPIPDGYIVPSGTLEITENGAHDVTAYASVDVNVPTGGGADENVLATLIDRTITEIELPSSLKAIGGYAFHGCEKMELTNLPDGIVDLGICAFMNCRKINIKKMPSALITLGANAFNGCRALEQADFKNVMTFGNSCFQNCDVLTALILRSTSGVSKANNDIFINTPMKKGTGFIYVPAALVDSFKTATNWAVYANQFRAIEDYTVDGTVTGELDPEKVGG